VRQAVKLFYCRGNAYEEHAVDVMDVAMFPTSVVDIVFGHSNFWTIEDRRLVQMSETV
jgi:hypothetical protein